MRGSSSLRPSKKILSDEDPTSKNFLFDTSKNFLLNKDSKDNIEKSISKEMEGKAPKKKSYSTILEDPVNKFVKEALSKFIQYCRGKNYTPKVTTVEKFASTLRDNAGEDPVVALAIVDQSIDKGWKDLYPLKNYVSQYDGNFNLSVVDHWLKEVKGVKYYFRYMDDMVIFGSSKEELHKLKRELDEFMAVNLKHNWQVFPTKVRGVDFVGYRFFGEYTLLRKSTCKTFKRRMLSISSKRENNVSPTYSE